MPTEREDASKETTEPHAKRDGRDSAEPRTQPGEFADDMRTNRFTDPPPPPARTTDDGK